MRPEELGEAEFFRNASATVGTGVPSVEREKNMKKRILISGLIISGLMLGSIALANPDNFGIGNHHTVNHDMMNSEQRQQNVTARIAQMDAFLELDEYQKIQIEGVLSKYWQAQQGEATEHTNRHDFMHSSDQDEATLRKVMVTRAELRADQIVSQRKLQKDLKAILTEEQQEKVDKGWNSRGHHGNEMHFDGHAG